ncbi:MAG: AsmA-like C-terminal region-containing protein [Deltaproteobacteria bacterium]|nr:AsmA-like C-terminal region-containing protein [Deltaproteobacteria bacterium]
MTGRSIRIWIGLAIFTAAVAAGWWVARPLATERLRSEVEERLTEMLRGEVRVAHLRVSLRLGLRLEGSGVEVWPGPGGPGLRVERVEADIRLFSHLTGLPRLRRLRLEGARLRAARGADGAWTPPPLAALFAKLSKPAPETSSHPHELLRPLISLEGLARFLLTKPLVADTVEVQDGEILLVDALAREAGIVAIGGIQGRLQRRRFLGDTRLALRGRLRDEAGECGAFEASGSRSRSEELRIALAATQLELHPLAFYLRELHPEARLSGRVSGAVIFEAPSPGFGRLAVDLVGHDMHSAAPLSVPWELGPLEASRVELAGELAISPRQVRLEGGRFSTDALDLEVDAVVERPVRASSRAQLALAIQDVTLAEVRHLIGWLPEIRREEAEAIVAPLEVGHLRLLRTGGVASFSSWQAFLAGRTRELPGDFVVDAELAETTLRVGETDRIENLSGRLWWTGDRLEIRGAKAQLNGSSLPELDLSVEGISNFFALDPEARRLSPGAEPLVGLRPLWQALSRDTGETSGATTSLRLEIERLDHPMFFWPIEDATALIEPVESGVRIEISGGSWAGVPVRGEAQWLFEPDERVHARFSAEPPTRTRTSSSPAGVWARGRFEVGALHEGPWLQESARGDFRARASTVRLDNVDVQLAPSGRLQATAGIDLSRPDAVPFDLSFAVEDGDITALAPLAGLPRELATGRLEAAGSFSGSLDPGGPLSPGLSGLLEIQARDGSLQQAVPVVVAIALASEIFNPFAQRETVRYDRIDTLLEFEQGRLQVDSFKMEGPDVRAFASGSVDVGHEPHPVDAEVVLFLFRPIDIVLEKIPLLNLLLLGSNENLVAAHFELEGPWSDPKARLIPLRSLATGPASLIFDTLPKLLPDVDFSFQSA